MPKMQNPDLEYQICPVCYGNWEKAFSDLTTLGEAQGPKFWSLVPFMALGTEIRGQMWPKQPKT